MMPAAIASRQASGVGGAALAAGVPGGNGGATGADAAGCSVIDSSGRDAGFMAGDYNRAKGGQQPIATEPFGAQPEKPKADGVADGINRLLQNLVLKRAKGDGIRDYFQVGVIGYGGRVAWSLGGKLAGQKLVPISVIANHPLKVEQRTRKVDDGAGGLVEQKFKFPVWFEPVAGGRTPMAAAFTEATTAVEEFIGRFPGAFPPLVINISDGKATDGSPELPASRLRILCTPDSHSH